MRQATKQITRLLLQYTPTYSKSVVEANIKNSKLQEIKDDKKLQPLIHYLTCLDKHKEYLEFFQIGVVRDQRKKIQNVAKYVGLAIRDYTLDKQTKKQTTQKQNLQNHSQLIKNWVSKDQNRDKQSQKQQEHQKKNQKQSK